MKKPTAGEEQGIASEQPTKGNAARCRRWGEKRRALGLIRITVEVPADRADDIRAFAAGLRTGPEPEAPAILTATVPVDSPSPPAPLPTAALTPPPAPPPAESPSVRPWRDAEAADWWSSGGR